MSKSNSFADAQMIQNSNGAYIVNLFVKLLNRIAVSMNKLDFKISSFSHPWDAGDDEIWNLSEKLYLFELYFKEFIKRELKRVVLNHFPFSKQMFQEVSLWCVHLCFLFWYILRFIIVHN